MNSWPHLKDFLINLADGRQLSIFYKKIKNLKIFCEKNLKRANFRQKVGILLG
jgi:hypothetical protein